MHVLFLLTVVAPMEVGSSGRTLAGRQLITYGEEATAAKWIVSLQTSDGHFCAGTILWSDIIISAKHCFHPWEHNVFAVAGSLHLDSRNVQRRKVVEEIPLRGIRYDPASMAGDIILLRVDRHFIFDEKVGAARLPTEEPKKYFRFTTLGWGRSNAIRAPLFLLQAQVTYMATCRSSVSMKPDWLDYGKRYDQFCAGGPKNNGRGSCHGDSGGPLVARGTNILVGIVSWGKLGKCAGTPTRYTDVYQYLELIRQAGPKIRRTNTPSTAHFFGGLFNLIKNFFRG